MARLPGAPQSRRERKRVPTPARVRAWWDKHPKAAAAFNAHWRATCPVCMTVQACFAPQGDAPVKMIGHAGPKSTPQRFSWCQPSDPQNITGGINPHTLEVTP